MSDFSHSGLFKMQTQSCSILSVKLVYVQMRLSDSCAFVSGQRTSAEVDSSSPKSAARWRMNSNSSNTTLVSSNVGSNAQGSKRLSDLHEGGEIDGQVRNSILHSGCAAIQESQHTYEYAESPVSQVPCSLLAEWQQSHMQICLL